MRIGGVSSARFYTPVHTPPRVGETGELKSPARTDIHTDDISVQVDLQGDPNRIPASPNLDMFANVAAASSGAGAGGQSQQRRQDQGRKQPGHDTIIATDGAGNCYEIDMGRPGQQRIGGFVVQTSGSPQPQGVVEKLISGARRLLRL